MTRYDTMNTTPIFSFGPEYAGLETSPEILYALELLYSGAVCAIDSDAHAQWEDPDQRSAVLAVAWSVAGPDAGELLLWGESTYTAEDIDPETLSALVSAFPDRWSHVQCITESGRDTISELDYNDDDLVDVDRTLIYGGAEVTSSLAGITITYEEGWSYMEHDSSSFATSTEGMDQYLSVDIPHIGVVGDLNSDDMLDLLPAAFCTVDYSEIEVSPVDDIVDEPSLPAVVVEVDNAPDIRFSGELIASVESSDNQAMGSSFSGHTGRWTELRLYRTAGGKYICQQIGHTRWIGERTRYSGKVCDTTDDVREFFGHRWLAKDLYHEAGIEDSDNVD